MRNRRIDPYLVLLLALTLPALAPLAAPGYFYGAHDGRHSVFYLQMFDASLRDGAWWPRWAMHHNQGLGYPTFLIQAPLGFYLGEIFVLLGVSLTGAAKLSWVVGFVAGAWGMYALVTHWLEHRSLTRWTEESPERRLDGVRLAAVTAGLLYVYFPYHLVDIYVRGALNDSLLLGWLPWLFLAYDRQLLNGMMPGWHRRLAVATLVLAGTLLTHTFALLSITPLLVTFILFRLLQWWRWHGLPWRETVLAAVSGIGALAVSAVVLVPLLAEGRFLQQQVFVSGTYDFHKHFVQVGQFLSPYWGFGFSDDPVGASDTMPLQLGVLLALFGMVSLIVIPRAVRARAEMLYLVAAGASVLFVMTPLASFLWEAFPPVAVIQFPWRLLALAGFLFSALGGLTIWNLLPPLPAPQRAGGLAIMAVLAVFASYPYIQATLQPVEPWREDGRAVYQFEREHPDMLGYTAWVTEPFTTTALSAAYAAPTYEEEHGNAPAEGRLEIVEGSGEVLDTYVGGSSAGGRVAMETAGAVRVNVYYFPGWTVQVDGQAVEPGISEPTGAILVPVSAGTHRIDAAMGTTPARTAGALVSGLSLLGCLILFFMPFGQALWIRPRDAGIGNYKETTKAQ
ncbi:MAG: hypothetical protein H3C34_15375 [Caldilineaceae bacterium]|nr:hypothetical protein [Caldilineaceae bacterium]